MHLQRVSGFQLLRGVTPWGVFVRLEIVPVLDFWLELGKMAGS